MWSQLPRRLAVSYNGICAVSAAITAVIFLVMTLLVTYSVFMRYVLRMPVYGPNEFCEYLLLACLFLGLAYAQKERAHIRVDILTNYLSERKRLLLDLITGILGLIYAIVFVWQTWLLVWGSFTRGWVSMTSLSVPLYIPQLLMPVGASALAVAFIATIVQASISLRDVTRKRQASG